MQTARYRSDVRKRLVIVIAVMVMGMVVGRDVYPGGSGVMGRRSPDWLLPVRQTARARVKTARARAEAAEARAELEALQSEVAKVAGVSKKRAEMAEQLAATLQGEQEAGGDGGSARRQPR
eukprot:1195300-Prorocentrum_minimum.AAC.2